MISDFRACRLLARVDATAAHADECRLFERKNGSTQPQRIDLDGVGKSGPKNTLQQCVTRTLVSVFSRFFRFQLIRNAEIGPILPYQRCAKSPKRHKILRPHRKHSPKSTVKRRRPRPSTWNISKQIIFDREHCVPARLYACVWRCFYASPLFHRETVNVTVIAQYSRALNYSIIPNSARLCAFRSRDFPLATPSRRIIVFNKIWWERAHVSAQTMSRAEQTRVSCRRLFCSYIPNMNNFSVYSFICYFPSFYGCASAWILPGLRDRKTLPWPKRETFFATRRRHSVRKSNFSFASSTRKFFSLRPHSNWKMCDSRARIHCIHCECEGRLHFCFAQLLIATYFQRDPVCAQ